jgi:polysaccharide chain length determinant protein (PEP-CTERM system associated)
MLGHRELAFDDYIAIVRRRKWILLLPMVLGAILAYSVSLFLHDVYTSKTLVLVEGQKVPDSVVKPVDSEELVQRLATMEEQILSRTRLQPIIEKFGLYKDEPGKPHMEDLVERLRRSIEIAPIKAMPGTSRSGDLPGFYISFTASNARQAQQICSEITSMFIDENLRAREQRAQGTTEFLGNQLAEAKNKLDERDAKLAAFKSRYFGSLPGQEQSNISILTGMNTQLEAVTQALSRAQQDKAYAESLLSQLRAAQATASPGSAPDASQVNQLEVQLATLQNQLVLERARYTDDHPDIIKLKNDIEEVKQKLDAPHAPPAEKTVAEENQPAKVRETPQTQQLRAQIHQLDQTIQGKTRDQARLQQQIGVYQSRLSLSPNVEQQFKELTRDYQSALGFYNDLLGKESQSQMATNLERRQQGEQFRVMDPANLPESPSFPNRPLFAGGGLGLGLALGVGIALLLEMKDKSLRTEGDIKFYLQTPTLALIPLIGEVGPGRNGFWRRLRKKPAQPGVSARA